MPTYNVTYYRTEYFDKEYEADSYHDAQDKFWDDPDKYTYNLPYDSKEDFAEISEVS